MKVGQKSAIALNIWPGIEIRQDIVNKQKVAVSLSAVVSSGQQ